jgi:hypothetical protein
MTQLLEHMAIGDTASIRGPEGRISYQGRGVFDMEASHSFLNFWRVTFGASLFVRLLEVSHYRRYAVPKCQLLGI